MGFKPAKCLNLLKLTLERIKILRSKHEIILKQTRSDVGYLLLHSAGQEDIAQRLQFRVELLVKEQNMLRAYDLIQQYCDLLVHQINIVHKHKECPVHLKEAIASLCYVARRSAELRELQKLRDLFIVKYGKEFVVATAELQPDCGVNTEIIEKLSSCRASTEIKAALLKEIAAEYNAHWDSAKYQSHLIIPPSPDLLARPKAFCSASQFHTLSAKKSFKASQPNPLPSVPIRIHSIDSNMKNSTETIPYVLHPNKEEEEEEKEAAEKEEVKKEEESEKEQEEAKEEEEEEIIGAEEKLPSSGKCYSLPIDAEVSTEVVTQEENSGYSSDDDEEMPDQIRKPEKEAITATTYTKAEKFPNNLLSSEESGKETLNLTKPVRQHHFYEQKSTTRMKLDHSEDTSATISEQKRNLRSNIHMNNSYEEEIQRPDVTSTGNVPWKIANGHNEHNYRLNYKEEIQRPVFDDITEKEKEDTTSWKTFHGQNGHLRLNMQKSFYTPEIRRPTFDDSTNEEEEEEEEEQEAHRYNNDHIRPVFIARRHINDKYYEEVGLKASGLVQKNPIHARARASNYYGELSPVEMIQTRVGRTSPTQASSSEKPQYTKLRWNSHSTSPDDLQYKMNKNSGLSYKSMQNSNYEYKQDSLKRDESVEVEKRNGEKGSSKEVRRKSVRSVRSHYPSFDDNKGSFITNHAISH